MFRKAYLDMVKWKDSPSRKPLLLLGARQVGKTWLMKEFGDKEYENVAYINCDSEPATKELFQNDYNIDRLLLGFQAITGQSIKKASTLIILDEIQEAPRALHSLKYFCEEGSDYHIMAAGSLLGVTLANTESFPVGKVDMLRIYPMDFNEFLSALNKDMANIAIDYEDSLNQAFSVKLIDYLRQYYFVGGMPEAVKSYIEKNDINEVRGIQNAIINAYRADISHHASKTESVRIGQVLAALPSQLARENNRFIYGAVRKGARAADFEAAIQWLIDAGLVYRSTCVNKVDFPLKVYENLGSFKLFLLDIGLLGCLAEIPASITLTSEMSANGIFRGMIAEQYVAQQLKSNGYSLYYWTNDKTPAEIDFIIQRGDKVIPIEVKSGTNVRGKSIAQLVKTNNDIKGVRFSLLPYKQQDWITNIPLYAVSAWCNASHNKDICLDE